MKVQFQASNHGRNLRMSCEIDVDLVNGVYLETEASGGHRLGGPFKFNLSGHEIAERESSYARWIILPKETA